MIKEFWDKLNKKQRCFLVGGAVLVFFLLLFELVFSPFWEAKGKIRQAVRINQKKLKEMIVLDHQFARQEAKVMEVQKIMAGRPADFSLFACLERKASQAGIRGNIKDMSSSSGVKTLNYEEDLLDIRLDKITLKQLTDFLYYTESPADLIKIKRITVSKMKESPAYLTVQLQLGSLEIPGRRPKGR